MDSEDKVFAWIFGTFLALVIIAFTLVGNLADDDVWNPSTDGCYVHQVNDNTWGPDETTITELCPVTR